MRVLVTGATGYIGGRLVPRLLERGYEVRVLVRDPRRIAGRAWAARVEVAVGDLGDAASLPAATEGVASAYYLVHSMSAGPDFARKDRGAALNFAAAARGVTRVVYLGGLLPRTSVSEHLLSRAEVGEILRERLPTTEFRAGPIIGSGSASFEMVRYLTERVPAMVVPKWLRNEVQPVGVRDVLRYLVCALEHEPLGVVEIGGDRLTFKRMMELYAEARGLRRVIVPVPVLAPGLAALWVGLVTPIPKNLAVPLVQGIVEPVLADTARARAAFPEIEPMPYRETVRLALQRTAERVVTTRWSSALGDAPSYELVDREGMMREVRSVHVDAPPETVYGAVSSLGGSRRWLSWNWAWEVRGLLDRVVGGPGLRRGRRHPTELMVGEAVDFWRVEVADPPRVLRLRAEMRVPGQAWLQFETAPDGTGARLSQTALFAPRGLWGFLYWWVLYPMHRRIFSDMVRAVAREAERLAAAGHGRAHGEAAPARRAAPAS
jgi:uncharacterized protein YbjT (DUF2867 family)